MVISLSLVFFYTSCHKGYSPSKLLDEAVNLKIFTLNSKGWELVIEDVGAEKCIDNDCMFSCLTKTESDTIYTVHAYRKVSTGRVYIDKYVKRYISKKKYHFLILNSFADTACYVTYAPRNNYDSISNIFDKHGLIEMEMKKFKEERCIISDY